MGDVVDLDAYRHDQTCPYDRQDCYFHDRRKRRGWEWPVALVFCAGIWHTLIRLIF